MKSETETSHTVLETKIYHTSVKTEAFYRRIKIAENRQTVVETKTSTEPRNKLKAMQIQQRNSPNGTPYSARKLRRKTYRERKKPEQRQRNISRSDAEFTKFDSSRLGNSTKKGK